MEVFQTLFDGKTGAFGLVLAHLPLPFYPADRKLDADDPFDLRRDVVCWRVADVPWARGGRLVLHGESGEVREEPCRVFNNSDRAVGVDDSVVPGGDNFSVLSLLGIPVGRDV